MSILDVENLSVTYLTNNKPVTAVQGVSLKIEEKDTIGIVGESGSGKSTLAMAILRLLPAGSAKVRGKVKLEGVDLLTLSEPELAKLRWSKLSAVFQKSMNALSPVHRIGDQMSDVYRIHEKGLSRRELKQRITELLAMVNLSERVYRLYPHELSGGMMQRVSIALSLMHHPKLLILDEATTALDVVTQAQILDEMEELNRKLSFTRMMITHDMSVVASACNKVVVMYAGRIVEAGPVREVLIEPAHPYTRGLLKSIPSFTGDKRNIKGIPSSVSTAEETLVGCCFADRCEFALDICFSNAPQERKLANNRRVACHLTEGEAYVQSGA